MAYKGLDSGWFPVVLGTLSISLAFFIIYLVFHNQIIFDVGKLIYFIVLAFLAFVFISWIYRYIRNKKLIMEDYNDITKLSFLAFLGVLYYAIAFFYAAYIGISSFVAYLFLYLFVFFYLFVIVVNEPSDGAFTPEGFRPIKIYFSDIWFFGDTDKIINESIAEKKQKGMNYILRDIYNLTNNIIMFQEMRDNNCTISTQGAVSKISGDKSIRLLQLIRSRLK